MKIGQMIVCCLTNISSMFLAQCWRLEIYVCNICLLFALLFVCLHVDHDVTNASLHLCLILSAPVYVLKC